jgi:uncharacterized protein involved in propanediol utilization
VDKNLRSETGIDCLDGKVGVGSAFGTFGELLQGVLPGNGRDFLVTFPISRWSTAMFRPVSRTGDIEVFPASKRKSRALAARMLSSFGYPGGGILELESTLPEGKGLASSSSDLVATARAIGEAFGRRLDERAIEAFLRDIEPSDGVMYSGVVAYYHREVRLRECLGVLPAMTIVAHDVGGTVDTIRFNMARKPFQKADKREYARLLDVLSHAVRDGDIVTVGEVATRSAVLNQKLLPRADLGGMLRLCRDVEGLGLVVAHSGTNLGILFAQDTEDLTDRVDYARARCQSLGGDVEVYQSLGPNDRAPRSFNSAAHSRTGA